MLFSYVENPRYKNMIVQFVTGEERAMDRREYKVGDYLNRYRETEVLLGERKSKQGEWLNYWVVIRDGQLVGVELMREELNKFDVAVKYGLPKVYKITNNLLKKR